MTRTTLSLPEPIWSELTSWLAEHDEVAAVLTARVINDDGGMTLLGRALHRAPRDAYLERRHDGLSLRSSGWLPAVRRSRQDGAMALFVHTHPHGRAVFSDYDDTVDDALWPAFVEHSGVPLYGSLVIAGTSQRPAVTGRMRAGHGSSWSIDSVRIVGDRLTVHPRRRRAVRGGVRPATSCARQRWTSRPGPTQRRRRRRWRHRL